MYLVFVIIFYFYLKYIVTKINVMNIFAKNNGIQTTRKK